MRGENSNTALAAKPTIGSSPRAWGKLCVDNIHALLSRIIPTCVGKTGTPLLPRVDNSDHPHVRGENLGLCLFILCLGGSSPRAWGKHDASQFGVGSERIIPTCVGKTADESAKRCVNQDHPHVRGENTVPSRKISSAYGSSPRAWGKLPQPRVVGRGIRIIPTCVGKTSTVLDVAK